jgi:hypothetical protein
VRRRSVWRGLAAVAAIGLVVAVLAGAGMILLYGQIWAQAPDPFVADGDPS